MDGAVNVHWVVGDNVGEDVGVGRVSGVCFDLVQRLCGKSGLSCWCVQLVWVGLGWVGFRDTWRKEGGIQEIWVGGLVLFLRPLLTLDLVRSKGRDVDFCIQIAKMSTCPLLIIGEK